jgi:hypothetical protein
MFSLSIILGFQIPISLYFSLFSANSVVETGSISTASATRQSEVCGDFPAARALGKPLGLWASKSRFPGKCDQINRIAFVEREDVDSQRPRVAISWAA